jgi:hypothetical protein
MGTAPKFRQGGLGAKKSPRWSAERRASPARGLRKRICAGCKGERSRSAGLRHWPAKGCLASTRALVGAPLPRSFEGNIGKARRRLPRENDDGCLDCAASEVRMVVPSPRVRGEGGSEWSADLDWVRGTLDRGRSWRVPLTQTIALRDLVALSPQAGRGRRNGHLGINLKTDSVLSLPQVTILN